MGCVIPYVVVVVVVVATLVALATAPTVVTVFFFVYVSCCLSISISLTISIYIYSADYIACRTVRHGTYSFDSISAQLRYCMHIVIYYVHISHLFNSLLYECMYFVFTLRFY